MTKIFILTLVMGLLLSFVLFMNADTHAYTNLGGGVCECNSEGDCTNAVNDPACTEIRLTVDLIDIPESFLDNPENFTGKTFDCQGHVIDAGSFNRYGFRLVGKSNNVIKNCAIQGFRWSIYLDSSSNNNTLLNCSTIGVVGVSQAITIANSNDNLLINNTVDSNHYGFYCVNGANNTLINNTANSNSWCGFCFLGTSNYNITNNTANFGTQYGFYFTGSSNNYLIQNIGRSSSMNSGYSVIHLQSSSQNNTISYNNISSNRRGISIVSSNKNALEENTISSNDEGIRLASNSANNTIIGNNINTSNSWGISINNGYSNIISENRARSSSYGIAISGSSNNNITENNCTLNNIGFLIDSSAFNNLFRNNKAYLNYMNGFRIQSNANNNTFINNNASSNSQHGFLFSAGDAGDNSISNSFFEDNLQSGINITTGTGNNFTNCTVLRNSVGVADSSNGNNFISDNFINSNTNADFYVSGSTNLIGYQVEKTNSSVFYPSVILIPGYYSNLNQKIEGGLSFLSVNITESSDPFNTTANISLNVSDCLLTYEIYKKTGFPTTLEDILQNGTIYVPSWQECAGNIFRFTVDSFSGYGIKEAVEEQQQEQDKKENKAPSISFVSSTSGIVSQNFIEAVVEAQDDDNNLAEIAIGIYRNSELQDSKTCSSSPCSANFTSLNDGIYELKSTAVDSENANASTPVRTIILDTTLPEIEFVSPTPGDGSKLENGNVTILTSASDSNYDKTYLKLFLATTTLDIYQCTELQCSKDYNLGNGNFSIVASAYDKAGNKKEIYREFEVYSISLQQENATQNVTINQTVEMNETKEKEAGKGQKETQTGITGDDGKDKSSETGSSESGFGIQDETQLETNLFTTENNPVGSLIAFAFSNPVVIAIPTVGLLAILYLNRDKFLPH